MNREYRTARLLRCLVVCIGGCLLANGSGCAVSDVVPAAGVTVRAVTQGPGFHWLGYYDVQPFDATGRYLLGMEADFEHRPPTASDKLRIGMIDLNDDDRWIDLGESKAWCWQQGCRLQWRPGSRTEAVWNDRQDGRFVCRIMDVTTRKERILPHPVYDISPDGRSGLGTDFSRLNDVRPGYGYAGIPETDGDVAAPGNSGIYSVDMDTGAFRFLVSLANVAGIQYGGGQPITKLCFNHIKWIPDGTRFMFFCHEKGRYGRIYAYTAKADGSEIRLISRQAGHYAWRDPGHLLMYSGGAFRLYSDDGSGRSEIVWREADGHPSYLPGGKWAVADSYPYGMSREQAIYLYGISTRAKVVLGCFTTPRAYRGPLRCDLHPRVSPDGAVMAFDSVHAGNGRQIYVMDTRGVTGGGL